MIDVSSKIGPPPSHTRTPARVHTRTHVPTHTKTNTHTHTHTHTYDLRTKPTLSLSLTKRLLSYLRLHSIVKRVILGLNYFNPNTLSKN